MAQAPIGANYSWNELGFVQFRTSITIIQKLGMTTVRSAQILVVKQLAAAEAGSDPGNI